MGFSSAASPLRSGPVPWLPLLLLPGSSCQTEKSCRSSEEETHLDTPGMLCPAPIGQQETAWRSFFIRSMHRIMLDPWRGTALFSTSLHGFLHDPSTKSIFNKVYLYFATSFVGYLCALVSVREFFFFPKDVYNNKLKKNTTNSGRKCFVCSRATKYLLFIVDKFATFCVIFLTEVKENKNDWSLVCGFPA